MKTDQPVILSKKARRSWTPVPQVRSKRRSVRRHLPSQSIIVIPSPIMKARKAMMRRNADIRAKRPRRPTNPRSEVHARPLPVLLGSAKQPERQTTVSKFPENLHIVENRLGKLSHGTPLPDLLEHPHQHHQQGAARRGDAVGDRSTAQLGAGDRLSRPGWTAEAAIAQGQFPPGRHGSKVA